MLTHIDEKNLPSMVDVGAKSPTARSARAYCLVELPAEVANLFDGKEMMSKKGPVFQTAIIAGTMGAKQTSELIPFCHPLLLEDIKLEINFKHPASVEIFCQVKTFGKTGVEMEALTGAQVAALTIYDMCKACSPAMVIKELKLLEKTGGKSDYTLDLGL